MKLCSRRPDDVDINLTSLIDVVLLLVIFFMVSTSFTVDGRLRLQLPGSSAVPERQAADAVVIAITADGSYSVNDRVLANATPATLRAALDGVVKAGRGAGKRPVTVRADGRATHQSVVMAMDVAGKAGFTQVNIATVNDGEN